MNNPISCKSCNLKVREKGIGYYCSTLAFNNGMDSDIKCASDGVRNDCPRFTKLNYVGKTVCFKLSSKAVSKEQALENMMNVLRGMVDNLDNVELGDYLGFEVFKGE